MAVVEPAVVSAGAASMGVTLRPEQAERLARFAALLLRWNQTMNLVSRGDEARLLARHLLDSLTAVAWLHGERIADLGTGAGLPGVPLAIAEPEKQFTLIDRHARRLTFVRQAIIELQLPNVETEQADIAGYRPAELFDTVVSRAVREPKRLWESTRHLLAPGGRVVALCGGEGDSELNSERGTAQADRSNTQTLVGAGRIREIDATIPGLDRQHRLMVVERGPDGTEVGAA